MPTLTADNPHDLMRTHEVLDILTVAQLVIHACLARKSSSAPLCFNRSDHPQMDPVQDRKHIVLHQENGAAVTRIVPLDFFGVLKEEYEKRNQDYILREAQNEDRAAGYQMAAEVVQQSEERAVEQTEFTVEPVFCSTNPLKYDTEKCIGCNRCASVCQCDILLPSPEKGQHPIVMYPGECYYCGACVMLCPKGAVKLTHPLMNRAKFVDVRR